MPSLIGSTVANNYLRVVGPDYTESGGVRTYAGPYSNFGTRKLAFYSVTISGLHTGYTLSNSLFQKALNGVASVAEMYFVGVPATNAVVIAIAADTDASTTATNGQTLAEAIDAATGASSTVAALTASGASIA